jgi:hypothetical protein
MKKHWLITNLILCFFLKGMTQPPEVPENDPFYKMGYLNVLHYGADNTGTNISTLQIRKAMKDAQSYKLACYFPSGTYLVDDTVNCIMPITKNNAGQNITDRRSPVYIVGDENPRPVIKLAPGAAGYGSASSPKPVFWLKASVPGSAGEQSNIAFNLVIRNMIFDLGENPGAVGVRFAAAQGSTIEDVKVIATGAFAGFYNSPGQGGGCYNIEVVGGNHAFYYDNSGESKFLMIAGMIATNQVNEIFRIGSVGTPMLVTGFHFTKSSGSITSGWPFRGGLTLTDGIIEYTSTGTPPNIFPTVSNNLYLNNVYIRNAGRIFANDAGSALQTGIWNRVIDYAYTGNNGINLINSQITGAMSVLNNLNENPPETITLIRKHTWDPEQFVSISMRNREDFIDVTDAARMTGPAGTAKGNGSTNDTEALQWAIDNYKYIFLPKGTYLINKPLVLGSKTQLTGAGKTYSIIRPLASWDAGSEKTMITTISDADAITSLSFILLETNPNQHKDMTRIDWKAGRNSIIRDIMIGTTATAPEASYNHNLLRVTGPTGGGRIYAFAAENHALRKLTNHPDYRHILVQNTDEPLHFYACNVERVSSGIQFEIKNSSNTSIYFLKSESNTTSGNSTPFSMTNSSEIRLFCLTGLLSVQNGRGLVEVNNCDKFIVTHVKSFGGADNSNWFNVKEIHNALTHTLLPHQNLGVFSRNFNPNVAVNYSPSESLNITFYPNPAKNYLHIINPSGIEKLELEIYNIKGVRIKQFANHKSIGVDDLESGVYILHMRTENTYSYHKFLKE